MRSIISSEDRSQPPTFLIIYGSKSIQEEDHLYRLACLQVYFDIREDVCITMERLECLFNQNFFILGLGSINIIAGDRCRRANERPFRCRDNTDNTHVAGEQENPEKT